MNKKGFTLVELLATIVIIALIMSIVLPSATKVSRENKYEMCEAYKQMMVEYAKTNIKTNQYYIELEDLEELEKVKSDCNNEGYVTIDYDENGNQVYEAHLSCSKVCDPEDDYVNKDEASGRRNFGHDDPVCRTDLIYDGTYQNLVNSGTWYNLSNNRRLNVGKQNVIASLKDKNTDSWQDKTQNDKVIRDCEIQKRDVTLVAEDNEFIYIDEVPKFTYHVENMVTINGVVENPLTSKVQFTFEKDGNPINITSITDVGTYTIIPHSSVSSNYNLKTKTATLTIKPRPITVTAATDSKIYDGSALTNSNCSITSETLSGYNSICTMTTGSTIKDFGEVANTIKDNTVIIKRGTTDVTSNFTITTAEGKLSIEKRTLKVKAKDQLIYGTKNDAQNPNLTPSSTTLIWGSEAGGEDPVSGETPKFSGKLASTGNAYSDFRDDYVISIGSTVLADNTPFLAKNYTISFTNGTLMVKNPCTSTSTSCGDWGTCYTSGGGVATYTDECGSQSQSCTLYSTLVSGYVCSTYDNPRNCCGSSSRPSSGDNGSGTGSSSGGGGDCCTGPCGGTLWHHSGITCYCGGSRGLLWQECSGNYIGGICYSYTASPVC